jgi:hypothetical protein
MNELKGLRDIKDIVQIPDMSFYIFLTLLAVGALVVVSLAIYIIGIIKKRKKSKRKLYIKRLKSVNLKDSKKAAYEITKYARALAETKEEKGILEQLLRELEKYKYIKNPPEFDGMSKKYLKLFLEVCCG